MLSKADFCTSEYSKRDLHGNFVDEFVEEILVGEKDSNKK
jgi:hypothetical protein